MKEDELDSYADRYAGKDLCRPVHRRTARPCEPEKADREENSAEYHREKALLGDRFAAISDHFALEAGLRRIDNNHYTSHDTEGDTQEGERPDAEIPMPLLLEGDRVGFEEEVDNAVDKGHIEGYEEEDRFTGHHCDGAVEVADRDGFHVNTLLIGRGVEGPVFRLEAEAAGFALEDDGGVALTAQDEREQPEGHR